MISTAPATTGSDSVRAAIDVGTNSVKLLVARVERGAIFPLLEKSRQTRLGRNFFETRVLQQPAIDLTCAAVADFVELAREQGAASVCGIGTSAVRDAKNRDQFAAQIEETSGIRLRVLTGDEEAEWAFRGVQTDPKLAGRSMIILDLGGGSSEFIAGGPGGCCFRGSFPLGTVRMLERFRPADPPSDQDWRACSAYLEEEFSGNIAPAIRNAMGDCKCHGFQWIGTGGTTTILARIHRHLDTFDRPRIDGCVLGLNAVAEIRSRLWRLSESERGKVPGLPQNRADVILMGAAVVESLLNCFHAREIRVSTRGLRFAAVLDVP